MISIKQGYVDLIGIDALLYKYGETNLELNKALINEDIAKLKKLHATPYNKRDKKNLELIEKYLSRLSTKIDETNTFNFTWMYENFKLTAYPFDLKHFVAYNIKATDYIELNEYSLVKVNYNKVFEIMAFDMMYRDLGITTELMEEKLYDIGITTIVPSEMITSIFNDSALTLSKILKIEDSPYASDNGKLSWDYFCVLEEAFTSKEYKDCVGKSVDIAIAIISKSIINNFIKENIKFKICALNEDGLYFLISDYENKNLDNVFESVVVRAFGRNFEVKPEVTIF